MGRSCWEEPIVLTRFGGWQLSWTLEFGILKEAGSVPKLSSNSQRGFSLVFLKIFWTGQACRLLQPRNYHLSLSTSVVQRGTPVSHWTWRMLTYSLNGFQSFFSRTCVSPKAWWTILVNRYCLSQILNSLKDGFYAVLGSEMPRCKEWNNPWSARGLGDSMSLLREGLLQPIVLAMRWDFHMARA